VGGERQAVDVADVVLGVALGVRHRAVEVVQVDELHDLSQHLLGAARHAVYVVPVALRGAALGAFKWPDEGLGGCFVPGFNHPAGGDGQPHLWGLHGDGWNAMCCIRQLSACVAENV